jgi:hypothetical protein
MKRMCVLVDPERSVLSSSACIHRPVHTQSSLVYYKTKIFSRENRKQLKNKQDICYYCTVFDLYGGTVSSYLIATCVGRKKKYWK